MPSARIDRPPGFVRRRTFFRAARTLVYVYVRFNARRAAAHALTTAHACCISCAITNRQDNRFMKTALAITHVDFEDLGTLRTALTHAGYAVATIDAASGPLSALDPLAPDLLVVMGGPIGVYEQAAYPFVTTEIALLRARLAAQLPTLGICLGSQLMAAALGARVFAGTAGKEIGWGALHAPHGAATPDWFAPMLAPEVAVLHWHGDTFDLPAGAALLASSPQYAHQAYGVGRHALALQCHPEVSAAGLERWYVGHASELAQARIDVPALRAESQRCAPALAEAASRLWQGWLAQLPVRS
jgi:GMP synthase (glutamine-hydrolysing)